MAAVGAPPEMLGDAGGTPGRFKVLPECWTALQIFLAGASQWIETSNGTCTGLSYPGVEIAMRRLGIECGADDWARFQIIEASAAEAINEIKRQRQR